jgi:hypothetical protein
VIGEALGVNTTLTSFDLQSCWGRRQGGRLDGHWASTPTLSIILTQLNLYGNTLRNGALEARVLGTHVPKTEGLACQRLPHDPSLPPPMMVAPVIPCLS